jgi:hypothetical protein
VVSGQLEDSLRHEIETHIDGRLSAIKQEILTLQNQLNESVTNLLDRQNAVQMEGSLATTIAEHLRAAQDRGIDMAAAESARAKASSDMAIVKAAIFEINEQGSQAEILKALVNRAASFAPRVAFFVVKGEQATGWRGRGFEGTVGDDAVHNISLSVNADTVIGSAVKSLSTWSGGPGSHSEDHLLLNRIGEEPAQRIVAVPLTVRNRTVAVLYADSGSLDGEAINLEAVETLVRVAGMAVELLSVGSAAPKRAEAPSVRVAEPSYTPTSEYAEPVVAKAPAAVEETAAPAEAFAPVEEAPKSQPVADYSWPDQYAAPEQPAVEVVEEAPVGFAEPVPAPEPEVAPSPWSMEPVESPATSAWSEPAPVEPPAPSPWSAEPVAETPGSSWSSEPTASPVDTAPAPTGRRRYGQDVELPVDVPNDEERRLHNDARRFARLLISEIKLYNEQKVVEGRSEHDLYDRLREYIDRSREMYDKRVKPEVASRYDYFHGELVNTLAEGDESKLGSNYPGATVTA